MAVPKPQDVLPLAKEITDLEARLAAAKRRWNLLFGVTEAGRTQRTAYPQGLPSRILQFLNERPGVRLAISNVAEALEETELPVGRALYRLAKTGKISNPARGRYMALEEVEDEFKTPV
jgi:hypothetical protein